MSTVAVVRFPGSLDHDSARRAVEGLGARSVEAWHADSELPPGTSAVLLPGGFSYGDHLRCGAIASRAPIMAAVRRHAEAGGRVAGICNGFQVLCESGLLPGVLMRNASLKFICRDVWLRIENDTSFVTKCYRKEQVIRLPVAHAEGNYFADADTLDMLEAEGRVVMRYCDAAGEVSDATNLNGSQRNIAGICDETGRIVGMMPHPERLFELALGGADGRRIIESALLSAIEATS